MPVDFGVEFGAVDPQNSTTQCYREVLRMFHVLRDELFLFARHGRVCMCRRYASRLWSHIGAQADAVQSHIFADKSCGAASIAVVATLLHASASALRSCDTLAMLVQFWHAFWLPMLLEAEFSHCDVSFCELVVSSAESTARSTLGDRHATA